MQLCRRRAHRDLLHSVCAPVHPYQPSWGMEDPKLSPNWQHFSTTLSSQISSVHLSCPHGVFSSPCSALQELSCMEEELFPHHTGSGCLCGFLQIRTSCNCTKCLSCLFVHAFISFSLLPISRPICHIQLHLAEG